MTSSRLCFRPLTAGVEVGVGSTAFCIDFSCEGFANFSSEFLALGIDRKGATTGRLVVAFGINAWGVSAISRRARRPTLAVCGAGLTGDGVVDSSVKGILASGSCLIGGEDGGELTRTNLRGIFTVGGVRSLIIGSAGDTFLLVSFLADSRAPARP